MQLTRPSIERQEGGEGICNQVDCSVDLGSCRMHPGPRGHRFIATVPVIVIGTLDGGERAVPAVTVPVPLPTL